MASKRLVVTDENEGCDSINVQIKVCGVNLNSLKSTGKVFQLGGSEYPMSRFGSWTLHEITDDSELAALLTDGGVVAAITWAIWTKYREMTAWVTNVHDCRFTLDVKKSQKKRILDEIGSGRMAKNLEEPFKTLTAVDVYKKLKVKLVKIIQETPQTSGKRKDNDDNGCLSDDERVRRIIEAERVSNLMAGGNYSWAFMMLKRGLEDEKNEVARLQMLIRLSLCAAALQNFSEMEGAFSQIVKLMKRVNIPVEEISFYREEYDKLFKVLLATQSATRGIEISFAFLEIVKKIADVNERLDEMTTIICRICKSMHVLLSTDVGACMKSEVLRNTERLSEQIAFMQSQTDCESLTKAQCVYYAEHHLGTVKALLGKQTTELFGRGTMEFTRLSGCWADLPFVVTRLRLHPGTAIYLEDEEFQESVRQISKNPSLLQHKLKDPKIAHANEVLTSEFGVFSSSEDIKTTVKESFIKHDQPKPSNAPKRPEKKQTETERAKKEKDLGNEAYKKKQFAKALSHYDSAISLDPTDALLHSNKAAVYISQERLDLARSSCLTAMSLTQKSTRHDDKDVAKITARLARIEFLEKRPDVALTLYQRSLRLNFDAKVQDQMKECEEMILAFRFMNSSFFS